ncbi:MAG: phosphoribosylamine--glycine ligase [Proteobacteria bacterium]|nr:phosphoribosylamine--glycine ligase [Pseudomonadota bacterium]
MKILIIGSGGREHALTWKLASSGHTVFCAPGNPGMATEAECLGIAIGDVDGLVRAASGRRIDLVVVGPEAPLVAGLADRLRDSGIAVFGPGRRGAQLEGSKIAAKEFFARHNIRTAEFAACRTVAEADAAIDRIGDKGDVVVKADGLAAGKGVVLCSDREQARSAARDMLEGQRFGPAGARIVVEKRLLGRELSVMAITDGERFEVLAQAEDHKAIYDGDRGPNTGGMGTVSPCRWVTPALVDRIDRDIFAPTLRGLRADGIDYRGVLYAGLMIEQTGLPWILEYNCRFGDPETQPILARFDGDLAPWLAGAAAGQLPAGSMRWDTRTSVCVVLASAGYPGKAQTGLAITGLPTARADALGPDRMVFHAGTAVRDGAIVTAGGRVLGITALAADLPSARAAAYNAVAAVHFDGMQIRRDIGDRGKSA